MNTREQLADQIRSIANQAGVSTSRLAELAGVSKSTIYRALQHEGSFTPSSVTMAKIAAVVGVEIKRDAAMDRSPIRVTSDRKGNARLQVDVIIPMAQALDILAILEREK